MKTEMKRVGRHGLGRFVLAAGIVLGAMGAQSLFAANNYWTGAGADTLVSTVGNWSLGHAMTKGEVPYFGPDATGKTAVFDGKFETDGYVWVNSTSGGQYDPATGAVNPVVWEATKPENGFYSSNGFVVGEAGNGALRIKGGTYVTGASLRSWVGNKCAGYLALEGGTIVCSNEFRMALGSAAACAEVIVGDGDDAGQPALLSVGNSFFCVTTVAGTTGRLTVRKGGTVSAHYLYVNSDNSTLVLDGGTLTKAGEYTGDARATGYFYGYINNTGHATTDKNIKFQVTENGGTINLLAPARFCTPLTLADGATSAKLHKRGPGKLTLDEVGEGIALVLEESANVEVSSGTFSALEIAGGTYSAASVAASLPAHAGKALVSGGQFMVRIDESGLADGVPVATGFNVNGFQENFELADGLAIEDVLVVEPVLGFAFTLSVDETGAVWAVPHAANTLPAGYTALSFIHSTGNQYILTDCELGPEECVEMDFGDVTYVNSTVLFGEDAFASQRYLFDMQKNIFMMHGHSLSLLSVEAQNDYRLVVTDKATTLTKLSDGTAKVWDKENPVASLNRRLAIFALNDGTRKSIYSFYRLKVRSTTGLLLHSFTPCLNDKGEPGLFDLVDRKFFGKTGTEDFLIPGTKYDVGDTAYMVADNGVCTFGGTGKVDGLPADFDRGSIARASVGDGITEIGSRLLKDCPNLTAVTLGKDVRTVGEEAFHLCPSLETLAFTNPDLTDADVSKISDAVVYKVVLDDAGRPYTTPEITIPGYGETLEGKADLTDQDWSPLEAGEAMEDYPGFHFFRYVIRKLENAE